MIAFLENTKRLGFPFLKIENLPNFRFMFLDRNEIHIQALVVFSNGKGSIFQSSSPQKYFGKYLFNIFSPKNMFGKSKNILQKQIDIQISKNNIFQR